MLKNSSPRNFSERLDGLESIPHPGAMSCPTMPPEPLILPFWGSSGVKSAQMLTNPGFQKFE